MYRIFTRPVVAAATLLLAGCGGTFDYEGLREREISGEIFASALAREYQTFALFEADEMFDWPDAALFGKKAVDAAQGRTVAPERPTNWRIPSEYRGEMNRARVDLIRYLDGGAPRMFPRVAARAQASFDCWVEQQEENWQLDHIAECRNAFRAALTTLEGGLELPSHVYSKPKPTPVRGQAANVGTSPAATAFTLFFAFDSAEINADGKQAIADVVSRARAGQQVTILVQGHSDRAGPWPYNLALSKTRAAAVRDALIASGVTPERVVTQAHGEERPRVVTPDGMREPRNRRVEIVIATGPAL